MSECFIVGGGISGLLTALQLHEAGLKVTVIDRSQIGQESSWAGGGILSPLYPWLYGEAITQLAQWSQAHYPQFTEQLREKTGIDPEYIRNGLLVLDTEDSELAINWAQAHQVEVHSIPYQELQAVEPELGKFKDGLWFPEIAQIRNPRLLKALHQLLQSQGIVFKENQAVTALRHQHNRIIGLETESGIIPTDCVVLTAGAWINPLLKTVGTTLSIEPVRGQMILFSTQPGLISRIILANQHYVIPRRDGHVLVGSTVEKIGFDKKTTQTALQDLKYVAFSLIPQLTDYSVVRQWAGLRPGTPNGIPYITSHPNMAGLYINAGHFRNGIVMGLASARLMADLILQRTPIFDPQPYALDSLQ